jgi:predicted GIY-YIG superfamily endonuclease
MDLSDAPPWQLYVLRCGDGSLYCGITTDLERRLRAHSAGRGARYTRGRGPLALLRVWPCSDESAARCAEARFKRLRRARKLAALADDALP